MSNVNGESEMTPTESKTTGTVGHVSHGSRETPATSASPMEADRLEKVRCHKSDMHVVLLFPRSAWEHTPRDALRRLKQNMLPFHQLRATRSVAQIAFPRGPWERDGIGVASDF